MSTVTQDARTALKTALETQFTSVRKYDSLDIHGSSYVTLGSPRWKVAPQYDQKLGVQTVTFPVHCYTLIDNADAALAYVDANFHKILAALGGDRTASGKFPSMDVDPDVDVDYVRTDSHQLYAIITFLVTVAPFPNVA